MTVKRILTACLVADCLFLAACIPGKQQLILPDPAAPARPEISVRPGSGGSAAETSGGTRIQVMPQQTLETLAGGQQYRAQARSFVDGRIDEYLRKQERWNVLDGQSGPVSVDSARSSQMIDCYQDLQKVLTGYGLFRGDRPGPGAEPGKDFSSESIFDLQQADIRFVEGRCGRLLAGNQSRGTSLSSDVQAVQELIAERTATGDSAGVVDAWQQVPDIRRAQLSVTSRAQYGQALVSLRRHEAAIPVLAQVVADISKSKRPESNPLILGATLADLYLVTGDYASAQKQYGQLLQQIDQTVIARDWANHQLSLLVAGHGGGGELREYGALLGDYLSFNPKSDGYKLVWAVDAFLNKYPYSPVISNAERIKVDAQRQADQWLSGYMKEVDNLAEEKRFQDSAEKLATVTPDIIDETTRQQIQEKIEGLKAAEEFDLEQQALARQQELQRQWDEGLRVLDSGEYDESIQLFSKLLTTEFDEQARNKIKEISLQAAKEDRRKAADLFIRSTRAPNLETKTQLLIESRAYLRGILEKYPDVDVVDKVMSNIQRVEKDLMANDPVLLREPVQDTQPQTVRPE